MNNLSKLDKELIEIARKTVKDFSDYKKNNGFYVASAIRGKSGKIYTGVNIYWWAATCAEQVSFGNALSGGERKFDTIVSVQIVNSKIVIVPPCGRCRQMFEEHCPDIKVIVNTGGKIKKLGLDKLLPYTY